MFKKKPEQVLEKFNSRKYRIVLFWNAFAILSVGLQGLIAAGATIFTLPELLEVSKLIPSSMIVTIAGVLTAGYIGVNLLDKKMNGLPVVDTNISVDPNLLAQEALSEEAPAPSTASKKRRS